MQSFDIKQAKKVAETIAKKHGLSFVVLFGSQATGRTHAKSDIDIGILGRTPTDFETQTKIWSEFADMFKRDDIEVVDLYNASPTMMYVVARDGVLHEDRVGRFVSWKLFEIREWRDTEWLRNLRNPEIRARWIKSGFSRFVAIDE